MKNAKEIIEDIKPKTRRALVTPCPFCGKELRSLRAMWLDEEDEQDLPLLAMAESLPFLCDCKKALAERERVALARLHQMNEKRRKAQDAIFTDSGMPAAWRERSLSAWQVETAEQRLALEAAQRFLHATPPHRSLFIVGDIGCGKSFLASCLARDMHRKGRRVRWARMGDILLEIRRSFYSRETSAPLERFKSTACLVLDDLGKERPTEWAVEQLFELIDSRYNAGLPLIVTSNYGGKDLVRRLTPCPQGADGGDSTTGRAIVDRLCELCDIVTLTGKSWRQKTR